MNQLAFTGFDWNSLDPDTRAIVQDTTRRLHELERRTGEAIVQIGIGLIDTKSRLGHGLFGKWLESEFNWSEPTAQRFMRVAEVFQNRQIDGFQPSALYALASGTVPESIREAFIERAEAGEQVRHKDVKQAIESERRRTATVDLDSGELIDDEPEIEAEVVDPSDPGTYRWEPPTRKAAAPTPMAVSADVREFGEGGVQAITPNRVVNKLNDVESLLTRARVAWDEFPPDVVATHAHLPEARDRLTTIVATLHVLLDASTTLQAKVSTDARLRAVK